LKEFLSTLNWVDYVIVLAFVRGAFVGYKEGIFAEIFRFAVYGGSSIGAVLLAPAFAPTIQKYFKFDEDPAITVAVLLIAMALFLTLRLTSLLLLKVVKGGGVLFNLLGMTAGLLRWAVILSMVFMAVKYANVSMVYEDIEQKSRFAQPIIPIAPTVYEYISSVVPSLPAVPASN